ncbi:MAG: GreA/GreB family elongation factor [Chloroflexi bacterium]|nr:GreA/GreB family elongation factor [Chloroflexota bacterium]MBN9396913.1 GreA/GreB family elongation factor [Candidatus Melainabacteria bacterium]OJV90349.1 MAG: hypothetical protein BGO39_18030 [Chloroflexi bacterium 54-19]
MSSVARQHAEWLSLIEVSGPFLSMPVLLRAFPQGLEPHDPDLNRTLRLAYEEWADNQAGLRPDPAIHTQWIYFVLSQALEIPLEVLDQGPKIPASLALTIPEAGETVRPDLVLAGMENPKPRLLIQTYPHGQDLEKPVPGHPWKATPATRMLELLRQNDVRLGLVTNGERWMLVDAPRHETAAFASWYAALWLEEKITLQAFRSLLSLKRFFNVADADTLEALFRESVTNQQEVTDQLGYQVRRAVEMLVQSLDRIDKDLGRALLANVPETRLYEAALTVMMRLVFLLSAEERGLLLLGSELYDEYYAASTLQAQLRAQADQSGEEVLERRHDAWSRLLSLFRLVYAGSDHPDLPLPAYGGNLFYPDAYPFLEGRLPGSNWQETEAHPLPVNNRVVLHLLDALQILQVKVPGGSAEARRLSFRALDVEQIGHVYEGLLDHSAFRAAEPVLGLTGPRDQEPEVALARLEELAAKGETALLDFLKEETGRSVKALQKELNTPLDLHRQTRLRAACDNDEALFKRVLPFAGIVRNDTFEYPVVITAGSVFVTQGSDRRSTGTHYTPRSLTEPIVQHALDPLVYHGPAEGLPPEEWKLRTAAEILDLKVCDMAMGSGAFLVQACRYLSEKLVKAWELESGSPDFARLVAEYPFLANLAGASQDVSGEALALARRLVSERCLYGVDKNPMAVEMAKLSLWLYTMAKGRPFTFLDHSLRGGDSLLGVNLRQLRNFSMDEETISAGGQGLFIQEPLRQALGIAIEYRYRITHHLARDARENEEKEKLLAEANEIMAAIKLGADMLVAYALRGQDVPADLQMHYSVLVSGYVDAFRQNFSPAARTLNRKAYRHLRSQVEPLLSDPRFPSDPAKARNPFHWPLEFPEVFAGIRPEPGFDALIGNPPFQGGQKITGALGTDYRDYLVEKIANSKRGSADLVSYFFLRLDDVVRLGGTSALIATNTIAQGDTREVGLDQLLSKNWLIFRAVPSQKWPGEATIEVSIIWSIKSIWNSYYLLDNKIVKQITSSLTDADVQTGKPFTLMSNLEKGYMGSIILGLGFTLDPEEAKFLLERNPKNKEVIFPYLNGEDLNSQPEQIPSRWVINFFDWPIEQADRFNECLQIIRDRVKPERDEIKYSKSAKEKWWQYERSRPELYSAIKKLDRVLVSCRVTKYIVHTFTPSNYVYDVGMNIFATNKQTDFAILNSTIYEVWVRQNASSLRMDSRYTLTDCYENFPFPFIFSNLADIGSKYDECRNNTMLARQEGLTKTYNRFHNPAETSEDIVKLRELHQEMDEKVAVAYGWDDLDLGHGFHQTKQGLRYTISEAARREVLGRLLKLNHERHAEEVAQGLFDKGKKAAKGAKKSATPAVAAPASPATPRPAALKETPPLPSKVVQASKNGQQRMFEIEPPGSLWSQQASPDLGLAADQPNPFQQFKAAPAANPAPPTYNSRVIESDPDAVQIIPPVKRTAASPAAPASSEKPPTGAGTSTNANDEVRAWTGSIVTVREDTPGAEDEQFILITERESKEGVRTKRGYPALSVMTPLGMKLLDRKAGDTVSYKTPGGQVVRFKVIAIS